MAKKIFAIVLLILSINIINAQTITKYQYWYDGNYSNAVIQNVASTSSNLELNELLNSPNIENNILHDITFRAQATYAAGNNKWSSTIREYFVKYGQVNAYEYWFDDDYNSKVTQSISSTSNYLLLSDLPLQTFPFGFHILHLHFKDDAGRWSGVVSQNFYKGKNLTQLQYWYDEDYANKSDIFINPNDTVVFLNANLPVPSLEDGLHKISLRTKDEGGQWSVVTTNYFLPVANALSNYQYWFDDNYLTAITLPTNGTQFLSKDTLIASPDIENNTLHDFTFRTQDNRGKWSSTTTTYFVKYPKIVAYEYWSDTNYSSRIAASLPSTSNYILMSDLNLSAFTNGMSILNIRFKDDAGKWSSIIHETYYKGKNLSQLEYWFDNEYASKIVQNINPSDSIFMLNIMASTATLEGGLHRLHFRVKDEGGEWSVNLSQFFTVNANVLFSYQYWFDNDYDSAITASASGLTNLTIDSIISSSHLSDSLHYFNFRTLDNKGKWSSVIKDSFNKPIPATWYIDADADSFGNALITQISRVQPTGYVADSNDCNDANALEHPNQVWYIDNDNDHYGTGVFVSQCLRPLYGFVSSELISIANDCNDNDAAIHPGATYFVVSNSSNFPNVVASPLTAGINTAISFEITYFDVNNNQPPATFPRVKLDYEGNGIFTNGYDRTLYMIPMDVLDSTTSDGKKYIASVSNLVAGTNYKTHIEVNNNTCITKVGPFNYPDILLQSDIEIFANDISFSAANPAVSSLLTINAEVHNESDYAAQNFVVHLINQYDTTIIYPDVTVSFLAPHSSTTVSWNIITPAIAAWCPMKVSIDYGNVITESNELDNTAIRAFINGNYNLPGGIIASAYASPYASIVNTTNVTIGGSAHYFGTPIPLSDSSVKGATVTFTVVETGATYSGYTNLYGNFNVSIPQPLVPGDYHIQGSVNDFTLSGNFSTMFKILPSDTVEIVVVGGGIYVPPPPPPPLCADLSVEFNSSNNLLFQGATHTGVVTVRNNGNIISDATLLYLTNTTLLFPSIYNIPSLLPNATHTESYSFTYYNTGYNYVCASVDPFSTQVECNENNNFICYTNTVIQQQADITTGAWAYPSVVNDCEISSIPFTVYNVGGLATGAFDCTIEIKRDNILVNSVTHSVNNIVSLFDSPNNRYDFSIPFTTMQAGHYTFELKCDLPSDDVYEVNENNNSTIYSFNVIQCKPNLTLANCGSFNVESSSGDYANGSSIVIKGSVYNNGNLAYNGNVDLKYTLTNGNIYNETLLVSLPAYSVSPIIINKTINAPLPASNSLLITVDPDNLIDELNETDNTINDNMCWDFEPTDLCGTNIWNGVYQQYHTAYLSIGVNAKHLYNADTLKVKFEVSGPGITGTLNLGNAFLYNVTRNCYCPYVATLPANFTFNDTGVYTFVMTVDPDNRYNECNENNNVIVREIHITNLPDMQVLSQFIAPSMLNPNPNQPISMNITYENIGRSNQNDAMSLKVYVDNSLLSTINPVYGLHNGDDTTIVIPNTFVSNQVGVHIIKAVIDDGNIISEVNENNNEATRSFIVGESANLYFKSLRTLNLNPPLNQSVNIRGKIANSGDLACAADVQFYFVNNLLDTIYIGTKHISVAAHDSVTVIQPWFVTDNKTTIIAKIVNSSIVEYTYDDNISSFEIGEMVVVMSAAPACGSPAEGSLTANIIGGEPPYNFVWSTNFVGQTLLAAVGNYTVIVTDATGQTISKSGEIVQCPPVTLNTKLYLQGYYIANGEMAPAIFNQGEPALNNFTDTVTIQLRDSLNVNAVVESFKSILHIDGQIESYFSPATNGNAYYIVVKHRNTIETWSAAPVLISTLTNFNFTNATSQAYGSNQIEVEPGIFAFYSGDINQEENIDLLDLSDIETDIINFQFGYFATDVNGDGNVDLLDSPTVESNINSFIYSHHP